METQGMGPCQGQGGLLTTSVAACYCDHVMPSEMTDLPLIRAEK